MFYLGIDAGGTKCRARLLGSKGHILAESISGAANTRLGVSVSLSAIRKVVQDVLLNSGKKNISHHDISLAIGIAGFSRTEHLNALKQDPFFTDFHKFIFVGDTEIANLGAHGGKDGATIIVGTGSIGIVKLGTKRQTIGGYGFPLSDLGSGAYIGLCALQQTLLAFDEISGDGISDDEISGDERGNPRAIGQKPQGKKTADRNSMTDEILAHFDHDPAKIIASQDVMTATDFGKFAPYVVSHAAKKDPVALHIMEKSAGHIEKMIYATQRLGAPRIALAGGLGEIITQWLSSDAKKLLSAPLGDPLSGATDLAKSNGEGTVPV